MKNKIKSTLAGLAAATVLFAFPAACYADANPYRVGDCNGDGSVTIADLVSLGHYLSKGHAGFHNGRMDVNGDGKINYDDYYALLNILSR